MKPAATGCANASRRLAASSPAKRAQAARADLATSRPMGPGVRGAGRGSRRAMSTRNSIRALGAASVASVLATISPTVTGAAGVVSLRAATLYGSPPAAMRARIAFLRARSLVTADPSGQPHAQARTIWIHARERASQ